MWFHRQFSHPKYYVPPAMVALLVLGILASIPFTMHAAADPGGSLTLNPTEGYVGSTFQWTVSGFPPIWSTDPSTGRTWSNEIAVLCQLGIDTYVTLDASGGATGSITALYYFQGSPMSNRVVPGAYQVSASDLLGNVAYAWFRVLPTYQSIGVWPTEGPANSWVTYFVSDFSRYEFIRVDFGGWPVASFTTDNEGGTVHALTRTVFQVPSVVPGTYTVTATDNAGFTASTSFTVTPADVPTITLHPTSGPVGTNVTLIGTGFTPGGLVGTSLFDTSGFTDFIATLTAGSSGAIGGSFRVPWMVPGEMVVYANDLSSGAHATASFNVIGVPTIEDIVVTGVPDGVPTTSCVSDPVDHKVKLEAVTTCPADCVITRYSWSGTDVPSGQGNPYVYRAAPGTHGQKTAQCTIIYTNTITGYRGTVSKTKSFKLFFVKNGIDQPGGKPNWYTYWIRDGAVPGLDAFEYNASITYGQCVSGKLQVGRNAAKVHYVNPVVLNTYFGTESFGGPTVTGIDCAAEVVAHEFYHKWVTEQWEPGRLFYGAADSDVGMPSPGCDDRLPDFYENTQSHTLNNNTDTYDLEHTKSPMYREYGDEEYMAMRAASRTSRGIAANDWANPGRQTIPSDRDIPTTLLRAVEPGSSGVGLADAVSSGWAVQAHFTGQVTDQANDSDGDGRFEWLVVSAGLNVTSGGGFNLIAFLNGADGRSIAFENEYYVLDVGVQTLQVSFEGVSIRNSGLDGPFNVTLQLTDEEGARVDSASHATAAYHASDFDLQSAVFSGAYAEHAVDTNGNGFYDVLAVDVGLNVNGAADYVVSGWLCDASGNQITGASNSSYLAVGTKSVTLSFDGLSIRRYGVDGPFILSYLSVKGNSEAYSVFEAFNTSALNCTSFEGPTAWFSDGYESLTEDANGDGLIDYLTIGVNVTASISGNYAVAGSLCDLNGTVIGDASTYGFLGSSGSPKVFLTFDGLPIYQHGVDGPYTLTHLVLYDENGTLIDGLEDAYNTPAYVHTDFAIVPEYSTLILTAFGITTVTAVALRRRRRLRAR